MDYKQTLEWMFSQLPVYQFQGASAYKADLSNIQILSEHLGDPHKNLKMVHVAGTNGKGSTSHLLASVLQESGYKTGLYTSPHLKDFRERIKINGSVIPEHYVVDFIARNKSFFEARDMSFFEMTVGLAFEYFESEKVDIAIIEVGLGGRLDATNIITPLVSVITNIAIDHTQFLGNTMASIAREKAGIIKPGVPVVIGEYNKETKPVFKEIAAGCKSAIYFARKLITENPESDLKGNYQVANKKTALQTLRILQSQDHFHIAEEYIHKGFLNVVDNTGLQGRWQQIHENPTAICDTAHNSHGLEIAIEQVVAQSFQTLHMVIGVVNDKDLAEILPLFPTDAKYYFCKPGVFRGLDAGVLQQEAARFDLIGETYPSVIAAYEAALQNADGTDFIYVGGSTYVVGEVL